MFEFAHLRCEIEHDINLYTLNFQAVVLNYKYFIEKSAVLNL